MVLVYQFVCRERWEWLMSRYHDIVLKWPGLQLLYIWPWTWAYRWNGYITISCGTLLGRLGPRIPLFTLDDIRRGVAPDVTLNVAGMYARQGIVRSGCRGRVPENIHCLAPALGSNCNHTDKVEGPKNA